MGDCVPQFKLGSVTFSRVSLVTSFSSITDLRNFCFIIAPKIFKLTGFALYVDHGQGGTYFASHLVVLLGGLLLGLVELRNLPHFVRAIQFQDEQQPTCCSSSCLSSTELFSWTFNCQTNVSDTESTLSFGCEGCVDLGL